jgi:hypothetical protein
LEVDHVLDPDGRRLAVDLRGRELHLARRGHGRFIEAVAGPARDGHGRDVPLGVQGQQQGHLAGEPRREGLGRVDGLDRLRDGGRLGHLGRRLLGLAGGRRGQRLIELRRGAIGDPSERTGERHGSGSEPRARARRR